MSKFVYTVRWADGSTPGFFTSLADIAAKLDLPGFDAAEADRLAGTDPADIDIEIRDEAGDKLAWILPA